MVFPGCVSNSPCDIPIFYLNSNILEFKNQLFISFDINNHIKVLLGLQKQLKTRSVCI